MRNAKFPTFLFLLGSVSAVLVAAQIPVLVKGPVSLSVALWTALVILMAAMPVRRLTGTAYFNLSPIMVITILLLYGTGSALVAAWLGAAVTALSSLTGKRDTDLKRVCRNTAKHTFGVLAAGLTLWGTASYGGLLQVTPGYPVFLRLLAACALCIGLKSVIDMLWFRLKHDAWHAAALTGGPYRKWVMLAVTPVVAYTLAKVYLQSGPFLIGMLIVIGLARALTIRDDGGTARSLANLIDALRFVRIGDMTQLTNETSRSVSIAMAIGRRMQLPNRSLALLETSALLHNIGYISANRNVAVKHQQLTEFEIKSVLKHPQYGMDLLQKADGMTSVANIVHCHHESPDGKGFPRGLESEAIPLEASIIKVAEAYVAMTSPRLYRSARMSSDDALDEIAKGMGSSFDPDVGYHLFEMMGRYDLANIAVRDAGLSRHKAIRARLSKTKAESPCTTDRAGRRRQRLLGAGLVGLSAVVLSLLSTSSVAATIGARSGWLLESPWPGIICVALLGLAALGRMTLILRVEVSWASALVLAAAMTGGPIYASVVGIAFIGWVFLVGASRSSSAAAPSHAACSESEDIFALIRRRARPSIRPRPASYGTALIVAGMGSWVLYKLGIAFSSAAGLGWVWARLLQAGLAIIGFYLLETATQALLLREKNFSILRLWQLNYLRIFPEPVTYAVLGYALAIGIDVIGPVAAIPLTLLPGIWRHSTLKKRWEQARMMNRLVKAIVSVVDERDRYTNQHSANVADIAILVTRELGKWEPFVEKIADTAMLHDIGKVSWPKHAQARQSNREEARGILKLTHQNISAEIAAKAGYSNQVVDIIRYHHEQFDGGGFPHALSGHEIPLGARILRVADAFERALHEGSYIGIPAGYRASFEIKRGWGTVYDPVVANALLRVLNGMDFGRLVLPVDKWPGAPDAAGHGTTAEAEKVEAQPASS